MRRLALRLANTPYWVGAIVDDYLRSSSDELAESYTRLMELADEAQVKTPLLASLRPYLLEG